EGSIGTHGQDVSPSWSAFLVGGSVAFVEADCSGRQAAPTRLQRQRTAALRRRFRLVGEPELPRESWQGRPRGTAVSPPGDWAGTRRVLRLRSARGRVAGVLDHLAALPGA